MAQNSVFKELLNQVRCESIPGIGFTQEDLDQVKSCIAKVKPTETDSFDPTFNFDMAQIDCIEGAVSQMRSIITAEQRKLPTAVRYSILRSKVQELRDNLTPIKTYYDSRYELYTSTIQITQSFTSEYLYYTDEYDRLTKEVSSAYNKIIVAIYQTPASVITATKQFKDASDKDSSQNVRNTLAQLSDDLANIDTLLTAIGTTAINKTVISSNIQTIRSSEKLKAFIVLVKAKSVAYASKEIAKKNAIQAQAAKIQDLAPLDTNASATKASIQEQFNQVSHQLKVDFEELGLSNADLTLPPRTIGVSFRLIDKTSVSTTLPQIADDGSATQVNETILIKDSKLLQKRLFSNVTGFAITEISQYVNGRSSNPPREDSDYASLTGLLYNGLSGNPYLGLYRKLSKPISLLYSNEERGLTVSANEIDPNLASIKDAPVSVKEENIVLYIKSQSTYEAFYDGLADSYPKRVKREREKVYPGEIKNTLTRLRDFAHREAADRFRGVQDSALRLARPTTYKQEGSTIFTNGTFPYSEVDSQLSSTLLYYQRSKEAISKLVKDCDSELARIDKMIKENSMDDTVLQSKISSIPCFKKAADASAASNSAAGQPDCEKVARKKLATDPLYLRTLSGTDPSLPDLTSQCYWKEFAKSLNRVSLLPFPDISGPPPINTLFRYWPINCALPAGVALVLLPVPPVWRPIFVLPTPLGTLVCFLTMPIAPIGIPLPSIYLLYFGIDGNKYMALSTNPPLLYSPPANTKIGFELDNSATSVNPLGLSPLNSYKGQPIKGSLTIPLSVTAASAKATRLASLAALVASGKVAVSNLSGFQLPVNLTASSLLLDYLSESEMMLGFASAKPSNDFKRQMLSFKSQMNKQLDKLGEMQTSAISTLRAKLSKSREAELDKASVENDPPTRRKKRKKARDSNPITLQEKIDSVIKSFNDHIDNIRFGTIKYPKDPTKFNPELPSIVTAILDIVELAAVGDLKLEASAKSLNAQILKILSKLSVKSASSKKRFDLTKKTDLAEYKAALKKYLRQAIGYLKGDPSQTDLTGVTDPTLLAEAQKANAEVQSTITGALALSIFALSTPIQLNIFDFGKKCCEVQTSSLFPNLNPELTAAFSILISLVDGIIDSLTASAITSALGFTTKILDISSISNMLESVLESIPTISLPNPAGLILLVSAIIAPILTIISLPKAPTPLHLPTLIPLIIPLDPLLKPLLKAAIAALIEAIFKLLNDALSALINASSSGTDNQSSVTAAASNASASAASTNGVFSGNTADNIKFLNQVFTTACGPDTTATLTLNAKIELTDQINRDLAGQPLQQVTEASAELSVTLADGRVINLPKIPFIGLDLFGYFHLITGNDIIELVRDLMNGIFDQIIDPIAKVVDLINRLSLSINTFSYTTIEAGLPYLGQIKLILMALDALIPAGFKLKPVNLEAMNIIKATAIPALEFAEPVLKEIAWIGSLVLCAVSLPPLYNTVSLARLFHPIMNQDDLPPWERLTHKNPLFAIFLDEIAWRGSIYSTGSLIFQTKTPAALPYTPIFPVVHISPHLG
jgi:hypothetical protein